MHQMALRYAGAYLAGLVLHEEGSEEVHGPHAEQGVAGDDHAGGPEAHE